VPHCVAGHHPGLPRAACRPLECHYGYIYYGCIAFSNRQPVGVREEACDASGPRPRRGRLEPTEDGNARSDLSARRRRAPADARGHAGSRPLRWASPRVRSPCGRRYPAGPGSRRCRCGTARRPPRRHRGHVRQPLAEDRRQGQRMRPDGSTLLMPSLARAIPGAPSGLPETSNLTGSTSRCVTVSLP